MRKSSSISSYYLYRHINRTTTGRAKLTSAAPAPAPLQENDHSTFLFSLAAELLSKGKFSAARKLVSRIVDCPSVRNAVSAVIWAESRGLELDHSVLAGAVRKLVDSGQFELAHDVYVHGVVGREVELDSDTAKSVIICLVKLGKFEEARVLFDWLVASGCVPCKDACGGVLLELCRQERFLEAFDCFVRVSGSELRLGARVYNVLIGGLCANGHMDEARNVFGFLCERSGLMPTLHLFKCIFHGFCKRGLAAEAEMILRETEEFGFLADKLMYTSLINVYCKDEKVDMAMGVFLRMMKMGCEPDNYTYKTLIHGFVKLGLFDRAWELCHKINEAGQLDDVVFHFMMTKYCKEGKLDCAKALFGLMNRCNVVPGVHHYTTLIAGLSKANKMSEIDELYKSMLSSGVLPDHVLFFILLKIIPKEHALQVCLLTLQLFVKNRTPDPPTQSTSPSQDVELEIELLLEEIARRNSNLADVGFAIYISALCERGRTDAALACVQKMLDAGCSPLLFTFNSLINRLCLDGHFNEVQSLIDIMQDQNIVPDSATYLIRIKEYCRRRDPDAAFTLLRQMEKGGLKPCVATYDLVIGCLGKVSRMSEAEMLFKEMIDCGVQPDETVYTTMINGYCRNGRAEEARLLFENMIKDSVQPNCHSYTALISGLVKSNMTDKACMYLHRMLGDGFDPNIALYTSLISHFLRKKEFEYAFRLVDLVDTNSIEYDEKFYAALLSGICRIIPRSKKRRYVENRPNEKAKEMLLFLLREKTSPIRRRPLYSSERMKCLVLKFLEKIKESKFLPELYLYNVLILGFCSADRMQDAYDHFDMMLKDGIQPNEVTFTTLIDAHVRNRETDLAVALFNEMSKYDCTPDRITYNSVLNGLCAAGRGVEALSLFYTMHKRGFPPGKQAYQRLLHCLCAGGSGIPALRMLEEMLQYGYFPRSFTVKLLLSVLCEGNNLHEARMLFELMLNNGKIIDELAKRISTRTPNEQIETGFTFNG